MGLFEKATLSVQNDTVQKSGLLAKIERIQSVPNTFASLCDFYHFEHAAILQSISNSYVITKAFEIDCKTIISSISSIDFWDGTLKQYESWEYIEQQSPESYKYYQFFSETYKDNLKKIAFIRLTNEKKSPILMVFSTINDFSQLDDSPDFKQNFINTIKQKKETPLSESKISNFSVETTHLFLLSLSLAIDNCLISSNIKDNGLTQTIINTVYDEIFYIIKNSFAKHICYSGSNKEIKIALFLKEDQDTILLQNHIEKTLEPILGNDSASKVLLLSAGKSDNVQSVLNFLLKG